MNHIDHIRTIAGVDHIGIGSDFNGVYHVPEGLEGVSKFPALFQVYFFLQSLIIKNFIEGVAS